MCAAAGLQKAPKLWSRVEHGYIPSLFLYERDVEVWMQLCRLGESTWLNELYHQQLCDSNSNNSIFSSSSWSIPLLHWHLMDCSHNPSRIEVNISYSTMHCVWTYCMYKPKNDSKELIWIDVYCRSESDPGTVLLLVCTILNIHMYNIQYEVLLVKWGSLEIIHGFVLQKVKACCISAICLVDGIELHQNLRRSWEMADRPHKCVK